MHIFSELFSLNNTTRLDFFYVRISYLNMLYLRPIKLMQTGNPAIELIIDRVLIEMHLAFYPHNINIAENDNGHLRIVLQIFHISGLYVEKNSRGPANFFAQSAAGECARLFK